MGGRSSTRLHERWPRRARHQRSRSASHTSPIAPASRIPSLRASVARPASSPASANERPSPLSPRAVQPERRRHERMEDREVLRLGHEDGRGAGDRRQHARRDADDRARAGVAGDEPGQRRGERADQDATAARSATAVGPRSGDERRLDEARERQPVRVRRDRQHRGCGQVVADLGEDPDEVDVQAVAGRDRPGDVDVVVGVGVGGIGEDRHAARPERQGQAQRARSGLARGRTLAAARTPSWASNSTSGAVDCTRQSPILSAMRSLQSRSWPISPAGRRWLGVGLALVGFALLAPKPCSPTGSRATAAGGGIDAIAYWTAAHNVLAGHAAVRLGGRLRRVFLPARARAAARADRAPADARLRLALACVELV